MPGSLYGYVVAVVFLVYTKIIRKSHPGHPLSLLNHIFKSTGGKHFVDPLEKQSELSSFSLFHFKFSISEKFQT